MRLRGQLVEVAALAENDKRAMLQLMQRHYENVAAAVFDADLAEKQWVIQVREPSGALCGFSTQMVLDATVHGRPVKALFSGDTIIDRQHWGDMALMLEGGRLAISLIDEWPETELYWFLISQGYKTYRFLPVFFREFYPRYDATTPDPVRHVIDALARQKFREQYDAASGIVCAQSSQYRLRAGVAEVTIERSQDPHVAFFVERNPGHAKGDELCCVARLSRENFTDAAFRVLNSKS